MFLRKNNQKGSSLVEVLGAISIISLVGIGVLKVVTSSYDVLKQSLASSDIKDLQKIISANYTFSGKYEIDADFNKKICETDKTAPNHMCLKSGSSYSLKHRLNGGVVVAKNGEKGYTIVFDDLNPKACITLSQINWLERRKTNIFQIDINNVPVAYFPKKNGKSFPVDSKLSIENCKNDSNFIKWYFY
ncbi:MAG: type II secretion system protein [Alphaproteobacteria bacterium]|nr:type II secretion system protein [Alphaproteobacteria bacterium]